MSTILLLLLLGIAQGEHHVRLAHRRFKGAGLVWKTDIDKCSNIPPSLSNDVNFIASNVCVRIYDRKNCSGTYIEIKPNSRDQNNVKDWEFNHVLKSLGPCSENCDLKVYGAWVQNLQVALYTQPLFKGETHVLTIDGCTEIPPKFKDNILSIDSSNQCIMLYDNIHCEMERPIYYDGTPHHNTLSIWKFPKIRAISQCNFDCHNNTMNSTRLQLNETDMKSELSNTELNEWFDVIICTIVIVAASLISFVTCAILFIFKSKIKRTQSTEQLYATYPKDESGDSAISHI